MELTQITVDEETWPQAMLRRLKSGETLHVRTKPSIGTPVQEFSIQPVRPRGFNIVLGYTILINGKIKKGYKGRMLSCEQVREWALGLEER